MLPFVSVGLEFSRSS